MIHFSERHYFQLKCGRLSQEEIKKKKPQTWLYKKFCFVSEAKVYSFDLKKPYDVVEKEKRNRVENVPCGRKEIKLRSNTLIVLMYKT